MMATEQSQLEVKYSGEDEDHIEQLLSDKLMQGYVLLEKSCPSCATPLVKQGVDDDAEGDISYNAKPVDIPVLVSSQSFDQPFRPIAGVPFCVACQSHVVTEEAEISILERCDSLKHRGSILVALKGDSFTEAEDATTQPSHQYYDMMDEQHKAEEEQRKAEEEQLQAEEEQQQQRNAEEEQYKMEEEQSVPSDETPESQQGPSPNTSTIQSIEETEPSFVDLVDQHDEKKDDESVAAPPTAAPPASISHYHENDPDDIMAEYSVRYVYFVW